MSRRVVTASVGPPRATLAQIVSIEFLTDHRDSDGDKLLQLAQSRTFTLHSGRTVTTLLSEAQAQRMTKPDWVKDGQRLRNDPISHTAGSVVRATITIRFHSVPGHAAKLRRIFSEAANVAALEFDVAGQGRVVRSGETVVLNDVQSRGPLPSIVGKLERTVRWSVELEGVADPILLGVSGPHRIFMTLDTPAGQADFTLRLPEGLQDFAERGNSQAVTTARMELAARGAQGATTEADVVERTFRSFSRLGVGYALGFQWAPAPASNLTGLDPRPGLHEYLWMCSANEARGECHVIAAAFRMVCRALGVKGAMEIGYMMPHPGRLEEPSFPRRRDGVKGRLNISASRSGESGETFPLAFFDGNGDPNRFEGVVSYEHRLYAIGDSIFDRFPVEGGGVSAHDRNAGDYFSVRTPPTGGDVRSTIGDENAGGFDLAYVDEAGSPIPDQYPWPSLGRPFQDVNGKWRWED